MGEKLSNADGGASLREGLNEEGRTEAAAIVRAR